ncbi:MAG: ThuA domain-containing protein [Verrucomicrobiota bacterium]
MMISLQVTHLEADPIKALLVTGGCCHDYENQKVIIPKGISERIKGGVDWTVIHQGGKATDVMIPFYQDQEWSKEYDIVVHNECFANVADEPFVQGILQPHREGLPAIVIHCTMHSYRKGEAKTDWWEFCGAHSQRHGPKHPFEVQFLLPDHEILKGLSEWKTPNGELYFIEKMMPGMTPLAESKSEKTGKMETNIWINEFGEKKTRVFGTTIGHHNETIEDPHYLNVLTRGFLWALGYDIDESFTKKD